MTWFIKAGLNQPYLSYLSFVWDTDNTCLYPKSFVYGESVASKCILSKYLMTISLPKDTLLSPECNLFVTYPKIDNTTPGKPTFTKDIKKREERHLWALWRRSYKITNSHSHCECALSTSWIRIRKLRRSSINFNLFRTISSHTKTIAIDTQNRMAYCSVPRNMNVHKSSILVA